MYENVTLLKRGSHDEDISNFNCKQITRLLENTKVKVMNQTECYTYITQKKLSDFCKKKDIHIQHIVRSSGQIMGQIRRPKTVENRKLIPLGQKYNKTFAHAFILSFESWPNSTWQHTRFSSKYICVIQSICVKSYSDPSTILI